LLSDKLVQVEFVAEDENAEVIPNIRMEALYMICVRASTNISILQSSCLCQTTPLKLILMAELVNFD
jgi:hypothetical protein